MKNIKFDDIKTPTTVEEFRTNLKTYYVCISKSKFWKNRNKLLTQSNPNGWDINSLDSLSDLYALELKENKGQTPSITPYINFDMNRLCKELVKEVIFWSSRNFESIMRDESRFKIYNINTKEHYSEYFESNEPKWYGIDNQFLRSFYMKTLGDFSGYEVSKLSEVA